MFERVTETEVGINELVDRVILWPRSFWAMIVVTAIAAVIYLVERRRGTLLPTASAHAPADPKEEDAISESDPADPNAMLV